MTPPRSRLTALAVLALLAATALFPPSALAATDEGSGAQTWAVAPADANGPDGRAGFDYVVEPDDVYSDSVAVRNLGEQPLTVTLYAQDAVQTPDNAFEVLTPDETGRRIGAWLTLDATEVTVPARDDVIVPFTITVPADAEPGDHAGGIVAVSTPTAGEGATVQHRVGTRIHLRVAGPVDAALDVDTIDGRYETRWAPLATAPLDITATLENTGNVRVSPDARVEVDGLFGWWSTAAPLDGFDEILPDGAQSAVARLGDVPPIGPLWITVDVLEVSSAGQDVTELTAVTSHTVVVWAVPWTLLIVIALLLIAGAIAVVNLRRRRARRAEALAGPAAAAAPEPVAPEPAGRPRLSRLSRPG